MKKLFLIPFLAAAAYSQDLQTGVTFTDGQTVTAALLNNAINGATIQPTFISGKGTSIPNGTDSLVYFQANTTTLKKVSVNGLLNLGSVAMSVPAGFSIAGSPVQGSGTLTLGYNTWAANTFLAGPSVTGAADATATRRLIRPHDTAMPTEASISTDLNCEGARTFFRTLSANTTFTFSNMVDGEAVSVAVRQAASGGPYTATFSGTTWSGGGPPTMSTGASHIDILTFVKIGSLIYATATQNFF